MGLSPQDPKTGQTEKASETTRAAARLGSQRKWLGSINTE
jgi:hypothetical protein